MPMKRYISDQHFYDADVMRDLDHRPFHNAEEMNEYMILQWNDTVKNDDEIYIIGDMFSWSGTGRDPVKLNAVLNRLKGRIFLIIGNHDLKWFDRPDIDSNRFGWIRHYAEIHDTERNVILSHYPMPFYGMNHMRDRNGNLRTFMLHGHVHDTTEAKLLYDFERRASQVSVTTAGGRTEPVICNLVNCFCGYSDYRPLTLDEWIAKRENTVHLF